MEPILPGAGSEPEGGWWDNNWQTVLGALGGAFLGGQEGETQTTKPFMYPGQEELGGNFMGAAADEYLNNGLQQYYPGSDVAALDPNSIAGQNANLGVTGQQSQLADLSAFGAADLVNGGAGRIGPMTLPEYEGYGIDPGLQDAVTNPIMQRLQEQVLPSINLNATSQGAFGGTRHQQMMNTAARDATGQMSDSIARANLTARGQNVSQRGQDINAGVQGRGQEINQNNLYNQAVASGLSRIPQSMNNLLAPGNTQMDIGQKRTAYEQALVNSDKGRFNFNQMEPYNALTRLGSRIGMSPPPGGTVQQGEDPGWLGYLGGATQGVGLLNSIFGEDEK